MTMYLQLLSVGPGTSWGSAQPFQYRGLTPLHLLGNRTWAEGAPGERIWRAGPLGHGRSWGGFLVPELCLERQEGFVTCVQGPVRALRQESLRHVWVGCRGGGAGRAVQVIELILSVVIIVIVIAALGVIIMKAREVVASS